MIDQCHRAVSAFELDFLVFFRFGSTVDTRPCVSAGALQTISGHFLREDGARILKSVSRPSLLVLFFCSVEEHRFTDFFFSRGDFRRRLHRHWIHARTSDHRGKAMIAPICFLVVSRIFARVCSARASVFAALLAAPVDTCTASFMRSFTLNFTPFYMKADLRYQCAVRTHYFYGSIVLTPAKYSYAHVVLSNRHEHVPGCL